MNNNTKRQNRIVELVFGEDTDNANVPVLTKQEEREIAYHESGHYLVKVLLELDYMMDTICLTIIPTREHLGANCYIYRDIPKNQKYYKDEIAGLLGGRIAAKVMGFKQFACDDDFRRAYESANEYVEKYYSCDDEDEKEDAILNLIFEIAENVNKLISENKDKLEIVAEALLFRKVLLGKEAEALLDGRLTIEELEPLELD